MTTNSDDPVKRIKSRQDAYVSGLRIGREVLGESVPLDRCGRFIGDDQLEADWLEGWKAGRFFHVLQGLIPS